GVRIGFLLGRSFTDEGNISEIVRALGALGATANPVHLGDNLFDVAEERLDYDLYVLKNKSDLAMSVAADLYSAGAALLNPYPVSAMLRDRIVTFRVLRAAGVPVPETFVASHISQLLPALDRGPLIVKPYRRPWRWGIDTASRSRSEEHTSELQSRFDLVCRLLLEKKKNIPEIKINNT